MSDINALIYLSASAAVLHTLVPDHEIPLAMIGRAKNWGIKEMTFWTLIAGFIHIAFSMAVGVVALFASEALAMYVAEASHLLSGGILFLFGVYFMYKAWTSSGGHSHGPFGHTHVKIEVNEYSHDDHEHSHDDHSHDDAHNHDDDHSHDNSESFIPSSFDGSASMIAAVVGMPRALHYSPYYLQQFHMEQTLSYGS